MIFFLVSNPAVKQFESNRQQLNKCCSPLLTKNKKIKNLDVIRTSRINWGSRIKIVRNKNPHLITLFEISVYFFSVIVDNVLS